MSPGIGFIAMRGRSPGALRGRAFFRHGGGRVRREGLLVVDDLADTGATVYAKPLGRPFVDTFHYRGFAGHLDLFPLGPWLELSGADRRVWPRLTMLVLLCSAAAKTALVCRCLRR
jgi:hypothetical protein